MRKLEEILEYNKSFVENKEYEQYVTSKHPNKKGGNLILFLKRNIHISALVVKKTKSPQLFQCLHSTLLTNQLQDRQRLHQPQTV